MSEVEVTEVCAAAIASPPSSSDNSFIMLSAALVLLMTPGLGYYYSGMARSKNALSLIMMCFLCMSVVTFQWFLWGFSLTFSETGGRFWGDCKYCLLRNVGLATLPNVPTLTTMVFQFYQMMFAILTPALIFGSAAERVRLGPGMVFVFIWVTLVYSPIAYWVWSANGWLAQFGFLDFAGGAPVEVASGFAGLAMTLAIGRRKHLDDFKASSIANVFLGTALLWFGWLGFNGGSALASNTKSANSMVVTNMSGAVAGVVWIFLDYIFAPHKKLTGIGFCSGAVAGLVAITPACGFITPASAIAVGAASSTACYMFVKLEHKMGYDDTLDTFNIHGIGGVVGNIMTGVFAQRYVKALDLFASDDVANAACIETLPALGWIDGNWIQVPKQLAGTVAAASWSFAVTFIIVFIMQKIPMLALRVPHDVEVMGSDSAEMGEASYDYVESLSQITGRDIVVKDAHEMKPAAVAVGV